MNWESTNESLRKCLEEELHFGAVESTHVVVDKQTGKSKAFGFATFVSFDGALACVEASKKDALVIDVSSADSICSSLASRRVLVLI